MILKEVIDLEEKLLKINEYYKTLVSFEEVLFVRKYMKEIASITDVYFELMDSYSFSTIDDADAKNNELLQTTINEDLLDYEKIKTFINKIIEKYTIQM